MIVFLIPLVFQRLQQTMKCKLWNVLGEQLSDFWAILNQCRNSTVSDPLHAQSQIGGDSLIHGFEVASFFAPRNHGLIAVSQSQKSHWVKEIAAIVTSRPLDSRNIFWVVSSLSCSRLCNTIKTTQSWCTPESIELASEGVLGVAVIFLSCTCSR